MVRKENLDGNPRLLPGSLSDEPAEEVPLFEDFWIQGYTTDKFVQEVLYMLEQGTLQTKKISLAEGIRIKASYASGGPFGCPTNPA